MTYRPPKKGPHRPGIPENHSTVSDLAKMTGSTPRTIERWWKQGVIPSEDFRNEENWKVWGPDKTREILDIAIKRKKLPPKED